MTQENFVRLMLALFLIVMISNTPPIFAQTQKLYGGRLRIAYLRDPISFNGVLNFWGATAWVDADLFNRLLKYDKDFNLIGDLAQSWESSPDGKVWTFHLRKNVKWHDGVPFTSADVKFHYMLLLNNTSIIKPYLTSPGLRSIETPDDYTVIFRFDKLVQPTDAFAYGQADAFILPKHIYEGTDLKSNPANLKPIGTGPFKMTEYVKDDHITMAANPDYFMGRPYLDTVIWQIIPSQQTAELAFQNNRVDVIHESLGIAFADIASWKTMPNITVDTYQYYTTWRITFNFRPAAQEQFPWLKDVRVRQAIALAIDRDSIVQNVLFGITSVADTAISNVVAWAYNPNTVKYQYDPAKAEALLDQAGYKRGPDGWRFHALMPSYQTGSVFAEVIKQMLGKVGIDVTLQLVDDTSFFSLYESNPEGLGDLVPFCIQSFGTGPDPSAILAWLHSKPFQGSQNSGFYSNKEVDRLIEEAQSTVDVNVRKPDYYKIQDIVANDVGFVFLWNKYRTEVWKNEFNGFLDTERPAMGFGTHLGVWWTKGQPLAATVTTPKITTTTSGTTQLDTTTISAIVVALVIIVGAGVYISKRKKK
ncbi:MAG: ABC transporter substrate-binding protein [Candidatus Bathyarchaeia archaeon]